MQLTEIRKFTFILLFGLLAFGLNSQAQPFQRLFTGLDRLTVNHGCESTQDGGFYLINFYSENDQSAFGLNVSKHDPKGNLNWSNDYQIDNTVYFVDFRRIDIILSQDDTLLVCGNIIDPVDVLGNGGYILKIEPSQGEVEASIQMNNRSGINGVSSWVRLLDGFNSDFFYMDTHVEDTGISYVTVSNMDDNLNELATTSFRAVDDDGNPTLMLPFEMQSRADSSLVLAYAASADSTLTEIGISVHDTNLVAQFSYDYTLEGMPAVGQQVFGMTTTPDTGTVVLTSYTDPLTMEAGSLLFKLDSLGNVAWAKNIGAISPVALSFVNDAHYNQFGEIVVSGKSLDFSTFAASDFALFFDNNGNVIRQKLFENENSFFLDLTSGLALLSGNVVDANDGHTYYSTTGINIDVGSTLCPLVLKMDAEGNAICEDTISTEFITDVTLLRDTMQLVTGEVTERDTLITRLEEFTGYQVPIVQLQDTFFCPQDPIAVTLNATVVDGISYLWSTGDTTPTLFVTEEGEYIVTVTFEDRVCFTLCDTASITKREFPESSITPDLSVPCQVGLTPASTTDIVLSVWDTGDTINRLIVTEPGTYSVTITDSCDNTSESSITIGEGNFIASPQIVGAPNEPCGDVEAILSVDSNIPIATYNWSTGSQETSIIVTESGDYSVTVVDVCGNELVQSFSYQTNPQPFGVAISVGDTRKCEDRILDLSVSADNPIQSVEWSTGETTDSIGVLNTGMYSVTVTDNCGVTSAASINLEDENFRIDFEVNITEGEFDTEDCTTPLTANNNAVFSPVTYSWSNGESTQMIDVDAEGFYTVTVSDGCTTATDSIEVSLDVVQFPNIFFPNSNIDENRTFKPFVGCPQFFSGENYELKVYNRWGNLVFSTTDVDQGWNGRLDGDPAPSAVYMYYATWDSESGEQSASGNVTLVRQ